MLARDRGDVDRPCVDIRRERERSEEFGQSSGHEAPIEIELEESIASLEITFGKEEIVFVLRAHVWYETRIANDRNRCANAQARQRPLRFVRTCPHAQDDPHDKAECDQNDGNEREPGKDRDAAYERARARARHTRAQNGRSKVNFGTSAGK